MSELSSEVVDCLLSLFRSVGRLMAEAQKPFVAALVQA